MGARSLLRPLFRCTMSGEKIYEGVFGVSLPGISLVRYARYPFLQSYYIYST